ncbi:response regulator transcription factor [Umezawaea endophytica]|uniref:response regulator transcription factor n=1 Tax=Umezawaea endophytica TaxID=1654476 RepID=UPI0036DA1C40
MDRVAPQRQRESAAKFSPELAMLNEQQFQLMQMLAGGLPDRSIARRLCLAPRTLARRISEIYRILGVETRFQAGVAAQRLGLIGEPVGEGRPVVRPRAGAAVHG